VSREREIRQRIEKYGKIFAEMPDMAFLLSIIDEQRGTQ
jgi:hypothetical protein